MYEKKTVVYPTTLVNDEMVAYFTSESGGDDYRVEIYANIRHKEYIVPLIYIKELGQITIQNPMDINLTKVVVYEMIEGENPLSHSL